MRFLKINTPLNITKILPATIVIQLTPASPVCGNVASFVSTALPVDTGKFLLETLVSFPLTLGETFVISSVGFCFEGCSVNVSGFEGAGVDGTTGFVTSGSVTSGSVDSTVSFIFL